MKKNSTAKRLIEAALTESPGDVKLAIHSKFVERYGVVEVGRYSFPLEDILEEDEEALRNIPTNMLPILEGAAQGDYDLVVVIDPRGKVRRGGLE